MRNPIDTAMVIATVGLVFLVPGPVDDSHLATVGRFVPHLGLEPVPR